MQTEELDIRHQQRGNNSEPGGGIGKVWTQAPSEVLDRLDVEREKGLDRQQAERRLKEYGANLLRKHKQKSIWLILVEQFKSLIIGLLAVASLVAFWFGEWIEGWAILVVILINALIGFFTELRAIRSMEALFKLGKVRTRVRRNGREQEIDAEELVPGDIVIVEGGDVITADLRILESSRLQADESALTGESVPVGKDPEPVTNETVLAERKCMLYKGTSVTRGAGEAVVVQTGADTELGQISSLVEEAEDEQTPLEERLEKLGYRLIVITLVIAVFVAVSGIFAGKEIFLMIETGIALAVAAIPEGLPVVATIALAKGLRVMASRNALINRLSSVETLGATGIICTDKTGTLTENRMTVTEVALANKSITLGDESEQSTDEVSVNIRENDALKLLLETGVLCNNASLSEHGTLDKGFGDPLEVALLVAARDAGIDADRLHKDYPEEREDAFDPEVKMMATWNTVENGRFRVHVKGAPGAVIDACEYELVEGEKQKLSEERKRALRKMNQDLAGNGLRMLAFAYKKTDSAKGNPYEQLIFLGLTALLDPPRKDVKPAIERCHAAGIRVVMITGDQVETARYIAGAVGLGEGDQRQVIHGNDLPDNKKLESSLSDKKRILETSIFARISPGQKLDLIEFYQENGHIVAMTGDGVNDAPALKKADIGIAMGQRGTQVAREAADMVLTDDAFSSIVAAIEQGRIIFGNIRRFIYYLMSCNVSEVLVVGVASIIGAPLPILPLQILFLNLVTDVFPALALGVGEAEEGVMQRKPRDPDEPILTNRHWRGIFLYGLLITTTVLGALYVAINILNMDSSHAVTVSFLTLALSQLWHVFNMRSDASTIWRNTIVTNRWVWGALGLCVVLLLLATYISPLAQVLKVQAPGLDGWLVVIGFSIIPLVVGQLTKMIRT